MSAPSRPSDVPPMPSLDAALQQLFRERHTQDGTHASLNASATFIIGFAGVIASITAGLDPKTVDNGTVEAVLLAAAVGFAVLAAVCGLMALDLRPWTSIKTSRLREYVTKEEPDMKLFLFDALNAAHERRMGSLYGKAKWVRRALVLILIAVLFLAGDVIARLF